MSQSYRSVERLTVLNAQRELDIRNKAREIEELIEEKPQERIKALQHKSLVSQKAVQEAQASYTAKLEREAENEAKRGTRMREKMRA